MRPETLSFPSVMPGLVPGIHVFSCWEAKTWMAGHRRAEATPSFQGGYGPAMTTSRVKA
jgi:hypothetical protein